MLACIQGNSKSNICKQAIDWILLEVDTLVAVDAQYQKTKQIMLHM